MEVVMVSYSVLLNYTDQGIRNVKQSPQRRKAAVAAAEKLGIKIKEGYLTMGPCNMVVLADAPNDEARTSWAMSVGSLGNVQREVRALRTKAARSIKLRLQKNSARHGGTLLRNPDDTGLSVLSRRSFGPDG